MHTCYNVLYYNVIIYLYCILEFLFYYNVMNEIYIQHNNWWPHSTPKVVGYIITKICIDQKWCRSGRNYRAGSGNTAPQVLSGLTYFEIWLIAVVITVNDGPLMPRHGGDKENTNKNENKSWKPKQKLTPNIDILHYYNVLYKHCEILT